jgi:hypothetical protein
LSSTQTNGGFGVEQNFIAYLVHIQLWQKKTEIGGCVKIEAKIFMGITVAMFGKE